MQKARDNNIDVRNKPVNVDKRGLGKGEMAVHVLDHMEACHPCTLQVVVYSCHATVQTISISYVAGRAGRAGGCRIARALPGDRKAT